MAKQVIDHYETVHDMKHSKSKGQYWNLGTTEIIYYYYSYSSTYYYYDVGFPVQPGDRVTISDVSYSYPITVAISKGYPYTSGSSVATEWFYQRDTGGSYTFTVEVGGYLYVSGNKTASVYANARVLVERPVYRTLAPNLKVFGKALSGFKAYGKEITKIKAFGHDI